MTFDVGDADQNLNELLVRLLGAFAHLQHLMDNMLARLYFDARIPGAADYVYDRVVSRIRDPERRDLFQSIAADLHTDAALDEFNQIFGKVKKLRDLAAHAASTAVTSDDCVTVIPTHIPKNQKEPSAPTPLTRHQLNAAVRLCHWLTAQVMYVTYAGGLMATEEQIRQLRQPVVACKKPTANPSDWDGVVVEVKGNAR